MHTQLKNQYKLYLVSLIMLIVMFFATATSAIEEKKRILIINSFSWGGVWADSQLEGFKAVLKENGVDAALSIEQMDVIGKRGRFDPDYFSNHLKWRFADRKFDLIIANDDPAFRFVARKYQELFAGTPVVFSDVNNIQTITIPSDMPYTGVTEQSDFLSTINIARKLRPNAQTIAVFGNSADNGAGPRKALTFLKNLRGDFPFEFHLDKTVEEIEDISSKLTSDDIVIGIAYATDKNGVFRDYNEVRGAIGSVSPAASFVFWKTDNDDRFAIGGKVSSANDQGRAAASIATRVLAGEDIRSIPIMAAPTKYVFNYPIMNRMGISETDLPEGSEFLQKPFSIFETFKTEIYSAIVVFFILVIVIFVLLTNIKRRQIAERALAASRDQLEDEVKIRTSELVSSNMSLNDTLNALKDTQNQLIESEKMASLGGMVSGIAHEINTPIGVSLTAASHMEDTTGTMVSRYEKDGLSREHFEKFLADAKQTTKMIISNLERAASLISNFKQVAVDQSSEAQRAIDLKDYIRTTAQSLEPELKAGGHKIEITCRDGLEIMTYPGLIAQILTNLVINSVRHGFGEEHENGLIQIDATESDTDIIISYKDNGAGMPEDVLKKAFDPFYTTARGKGGSGLGLSIVYNLVTHKLQGKLSCKSTLGAGSEFTISFPK